MNNTQRETSDATSTRVSYNKLMSWARIDQCMFQMDMQQMMTLCEWEKRDLAVFVDFVRRNLQLDGQELLDFTIELKNRVRSFEKK